MTPTHMPEYDVSRLTIVYAEPPPGGGGAGGGKKKTKADGKKKAKPKK